MYSTCDKFLVILKYRQYYYIQSNIKHVDIEYLLYVCRSIILTLVKIVNDLLITINEQIYEFYILLHPNSTYYGTTFMCWGIIDDSLVTKTSEVIKLVGQFGNLWPACTSQT